VDTKEQFYAGNRDSSAIEVLEIEHGPGSGLDAAMILLDDVGQILAHRVRASRQPLRNRRVALSSRSQKNDPPPHRQRCLRATAPRRKLDSLLRSDRYKPNSTAFRHRYPTLYPVQETCLFMMFILDS